MKTFELTISINEDGNTYKKIVKITAENKDEISEKFSALKSLSEVITHEDFMVSVELIKEKPGLIPVIKNMIQEGESLSETQLMLKLPKYVSKVLKVLKS